MSSSPIYTEFKPTYLYIKQHTITGKLYFGKTIRNPEKYLGSGTHWLSHIKKHGRDHVINLWYSLFHNKDECTNFALMFSEVNQIVVSIEWLNLKLENGLDGGVVGMIRMIHIKTGERKCFSILERESMISEGWVVWSKGFMRFKDQIGSELWLHTNDPRILELRLHPWTKGKKVMVQHNKVIWVDRDKVTEDMTSIVKNTVSVVDTDGNFSRVSDTDPEYISGNLRGVNAGKIGLTKHLNSVKVKCPHCTIETTRGNAMRWHFDNCRFKG